MHLPSIHLIRPLLLGLALFLLTTGAHADLCGDQVTTRFAQFPNAVASTVTCPGVELPCAGPDLGTVGNSCRFMIDFSNHSVRIDFTEADYGAGASFTFGDLSCPICGGTVDGVLSGVQLNHFNASGFEPEVSFTDDAVTVTIAKDVTRWKEGDFIELRFTFDGECPLDDRLSHRSGWVPNVGQLQAGEFPLGDLYLFRCPAGATVRAAVDTKDDRDDGTSCLDPVLELFDGDGNLRALGDDQFDCTYPPVCGFSCPRIQNVSCGDGGVYSLVVRDFGASTLAEPCNKGGGYEMTLELTDSATGQPIPTSEVQLGLGGPQRMLLPWLNGLGFSETGANLDDENVPALQAIPLQFVDPGTMLRVQAAHGKGGTVAPDSH